MQRLTKMSRHYIKESFNEEHIFCMVKGINIKTNGESLNDRGQKLKNPCPWNERNAAQFIFYIILHATGWSKASCSEKDIVRISSLLNNWNHEGRIADSKPADEAKISVNKV